MNEHDINNAGRNGHDRVSNGVRAFYSSIAKFYMSTQVIVM